MSNIFNNVANSSVQKNIFDLTHDVKLSSKMGYLTPSCIIDVIPGDEFRIKASAMVRLAPTIAPVMHRIDVFQHFFFVPNRLLWDGWEDFITKGEDGTDNTVHPFLELNTDFILNGTLGDYLGLPTKESLPQSADMKVNAIPFAAYQKIWDDYYRDENLQDRLEPQLTDGDNTAQFNTLGVLHTRHWAKDYFTSALPWTQRGPEALLPLNGTADLIVIDPTNVQQRFMTFDNGQPAATNGWESLQWNDATGAGYLRTPSEPTRGYIAVEDSHMVDLSTATQTSIIELRRAFALQSWLEKNATGGARYIESMSVHFGVTSSDKRLQRPEYIGGFQAPVKMSEVLQTSESQTTPQGNMSGHGISVGGSRTYTYRSEEHGYIIGIMSVLPKASYFQGVAKHWRRFDTFDYAWPSFAHIGEQPIENMELYLSPDTTVNEQTFGYTPRYAEYKFMNNRVSGDFRSNLDFWHLARKFDDTPNLNASFTICDTDSIDERIFAVGGITDNLWSHVLNEVSVTRALPIFGTPQIR